MSDGDRRLAERLVEALPDAVVMVDGAGRIVLVNHETERLFGYARAELLGQPVERLVPERFRDHPVHRTRYVADPHRRPMGAGLELFARRRDGTEFPVEISLSPLETEEGLLVTATIRDITERRRAQQVLEDRTRELEATREELVRQERLATLGQLAGGVSHELRNPLGVIKNSVYYLRMVMPDDERMKKHLAILEREVQTASKIVGDLLDFGRRSPPVRVPTAVGDLVERVLERTPVPASIRVELDLAPDLPAITVDPGQVEQILGNLVRNAAQAMPDGGALAIRAVRAGDGVQVAVEDSGAGIPPENLERVFQPLFTTRAKGMGLGLAISRRLAESNGARLTVESELDRGSRFLLHFPG